MLNRPPSCELQGFSLPPRLLPQGFGSSTSRIPPAELGRRAGAGRRLPQAAAGDGGVSEVDVAADFQAAGAGEADVGPGSSVLEGWL